MIDFEVDWTRWFPATEQPDDKKLTSARKEAARCTKGADEVSRYMDDGLGDRALSELIADVENAIGDLRDAQEETEARFKDAEFAAEQAREGFAWFLQRHKAVLVTNRRFKSDPVGIHPPEVVSWVDNNCRGDYQTFDVDADVAIVFFDDADRLHCKMRWG